MSHVLRVGREFGLILLYILAGTLAAFIVVVGFTEHQRVGQMDASLAQIFRIAGLPADPKIQTGLNADTLRAATELLKQVQQDQQQQRQFWQQLAQMVLLNLLLPLLTAVFGFVFGREQRDRDDRFNSPRRKEGGGG